MDLSDFQMPRMWRVQQRFDPRRIEENDLAGEVRERFERSGMRKQVPKGGEIAVAVGSRGIRHLEVMVKATVEWVKECGGVPFLVPAMGSHGGATAEGQVEVLAKYGVSEEVMGCEVRSVMEPRELKQGVSPVRVFFDQYAYDAAGVILINRIKPHTSFHGRYESGLMKMLAIGLGKQKQALAIHETGVRGLREVMPVVAEEILGQVNVLGGLAVVENAYDEPCRVEAVLGVDFAEREPKLLDMARERMSRLPLDEVDILVVDRLGKDISGVGMDPNVIGRMRIPGEAEPESPRVRMVVAGGLSEGSGGNALGMGLADICTREFYEAVDFQVVKENVYTSTFLERAKVPVVADDMREALAMAVRGCWAKNVDDLIVMRIQDTLHLGEVLVSEKGMEVLRGRGGEGRFDVASDPVEWECGWQI